MAELCCLIAALMIFGALCATITAPLVFVGAAVASERERKEKKEKIEREKRLDEWVRRQAP